MFSLTERKGENILSRKLSRIYNRFHLYTYADNDELKINSFARSVHYINLIMLLIKTLPTAWFFFIRRALIYRNRSLQAGSF